MSRHATELAHSSILRSGTGHQARHPQSHHHEQQQHQHHQQQQQELHHEHGTYVRFAQQYYSRDDHLQHLDTVFYITHLVMSAIHKRLLVTSREQRAFQLAMSIFAGALLVRLFFKPLYSRIRPQLVFVIHVLLTIIRAAVVFTMASKQAVHARYGMVAEEMNTAGILFMTMLAILGGPFRLFEMLGLQQPWRLHAVISVLYLALHPWAAMDGIRMAYSNTMFYQVHAVHDGVSAVVDALLDTITGMPLGQQQTCSSCAGVAIYGFMCLFGSVAVPLYVMYVWEQAAQHRWQQQVNSITTEAATTPTTSADDAGSSSPAAEPAIGSSRSTAQHSKPSRGIATETRGAAQRCSTAREVQPRQLTTHSASSSDTMKSMSTSDSRSQSGGSSTNSNSRGMTRLDAILLKAEELAAAEGAAVPRLSLSDVLSSSNAVVRWCVHVLVLLVLLGGCWLVSNAVALMLLPRVLSSQQLDRWCPNRPYAPYVIAGQVYDGL